MLKTTQKENKQKDYKFSNPDPATCRFEILNQIVVLAFFNQTELSVVFKNALICNSPVTKTNYLQLKCNYNLPGFSGIFSRIKTTGKNI